MFYLYYLFIYNFRKKKHFAFRILSFQVLFSISLFSISDVNLAISVYFEIQLILLFFYFAA